ncbi:molybdate ABC transporter substrate-binding protein [Paenibacillus pasadenensis]|uniref:molybdate ABC transporter substrate-binding protein n=1 Tax=Paenibacillus pasadenensis TaxID=217090 RepID=UPI00203BEDA3|nr:molybdate ABC transporter substrate-binding protein [Paenibacillus pasadenensis]MCM3749440.1 molybdate ABC transporter substrate-binding protein [Paenibacillus pasadenensis]
MKRYPTYKEKNLAYLFAILALGLLLLAAGCGAVNSETEANDNGGASNTQSNGTATSNENAGAGAPSASSPPGEAVKLTVSAAASLTEALGKIEEQFEISHPNIEIQYNFGASGALQKQIEQGAPADLFFSASDKNMSALIKQGLVKPEQNDQLLINTLVLAAPKESTQAPKTLDALKESNFSRIAIGIPESVPAGQYARQALEASGLWDTLSSKLVQAKDVKSVLQMIETGNADAGFVYKTDVLGSDKAKILLDVDPAAYSPIVYPAGVLSSTDHPEEAAAFWDYLRSDKAIAVFTEYGFTAAP